MLYIILALIMFGLLIAVHEFGHFAAAKLFGIQVNEFSIGMGPALLKKQKGDTLYSLRLFPVGGYCAMEGEDEATDDPGSFSSKPGWKKFIILVAGSLMNFLTGLVLLLPCVLLTGVEIDSRRERRFSRVTDVTISTGHKAREEKA